MSTSTSQTPAFRIIVTAIALCATGIGIYTFTTQSEPPIATASTAPAASTKIAAANNAWSANPMLPTKSTPDNASATPLTAVPEVHDHTASAPSAREKNALAELLLPADLVPVSADGTTENAPFARIALDGVSSGSEAIVRLGDNLEPVAKWYGKSSAQFRELLLTDSSAHIDRKGRMLYIDQANEQHIVSSNTSTKNSVAAADSAKLWWKVERTFLQHSRQGSNRVLYLNFKGYGKDFPAYDTDGNDTLSNEEHAWIQRVYWRVVQDFRAFDVDVTTEPPLAAPGKLGATILITSAPRPADKSLGSSGLGTFQTFNPAYVNSVCFAKAAPDEERMSQCLSHELGHTLGLLHMGVKNVSSYFGGFWEDFAGNPNGETSWGPIMGSAGGAKMKQWTKGDYKDTNGNPSDNHEDEYAIMLRYGLHPLVDDGKSGVPTVLSQKAANGFNNLSGTGMIGIPVNGVPDSDVFKFTAGAGNIRLKVSLAEIGSKLDVGLRLMDHNGKTVLTNFTDPTLAKGLAYYSSTGGIYYLQVSGIGRSGKPGYTNNGYTSYGSIGAYTITGTSLLP